VNWVKDFWPALVAAAAIVGFAYVADYRLRSVESRLEKTNIEQMSWQMRTLRCEVRNIKKVLEQKPEIDCDPDR